MSPAASTKTSEPRVLISATEAETFDFARFPLLAGWRLGELLLSTNLATLRLCAPDSIDGVEPTTLYPSFRDIALAFDTDLKQMGLWVPFALLIELPGNTQEAQLIQWRQLDANTDENRGQFLLLAELATEPDKADTRCRALHRAGPVPESLKLELHFRNDEDYRRALRDRPGKDLNAMHSTLLDHFVEPNWHDPDKILGEIRESLPHLPLPDRVRRVQQEEYDSPETTDPA